MPQAGIDSVTVPGAVEGWAKAHARFGRLPWKDLFTPAIYYAEHGYPVPELIHDFWEGEEQALKQTPEAERIYLPGGKVPEVGEMFTNPDLGKTLRLIAEGGRDAFYRGEIAQSIVATSTELGGTMQARRSGRFFGGVGGADFHHLSRLEGLRTSSQRTRHGRARNAQYHEHPAPGQSRARWRRWNCTTASRP